MFVVVFFLLVAGASAACLALFMRLIDRHVDDAIERHVGAALDEPDFDRHVTQALVIVALPHQRAALDDAARRP